MSTKRWLDEASDADRFERSILTSGLDADPPAHAEGEVFQRVLVAVAPPLGPGPGGGASGGAAAVTKGATVATLGKGFLLGVAATVAVAGGNRLLHDSAPHGGGSVARPALSAPWTEASPLERSRERAAVAALAPSAGSLEVAPAEPVGPPRHDPAPQHAPGAPVLEARGGSPLAAATPRQPSSVAAFPISDASSPAPQSRLDEEAALLRQARSELRAGSLAAAFATLEASRAKFSAPELYQEREALLIELLSRSGQREQARERAQRFLARFPESPHAAAVRAFAASSR